MTVDELFQALTEIPELAFFCQPHEIQYWSPEQKKRILLLVRDLELLNRDGLSLTSLVGPKARRAMDLLQ